MDWFWWAFKVTCGGGLGVALVLVLLHVLIEVRDLFDEWLYGRDSRGKD